MNKNEMRINTNFDFGFEFSDDLSQQALDNARKAEIAQGKAETMFNMIMPLLNNLKKNPQKPNIVWPGREKKIDEFIKKLEDVLNS